MRNMRPGLFLAAVLAVFLSAGSGAQETLPQNIPQTLPQSIPLTLPQSIPESARDSFPQYVPLFTPQQIAKASAQARKRMQATEDMNRRAWVARRNKSAEAKARNEAAVRAAAQPAAPTYTRKNKIYKSVDAKGRVVFGDVPSGKNSQQIKLRNTRPPQGAPPPATAPNLRKSDEDS